MIVVRYHRNAKVGLFLLIIHVLMTYYNVLNPTEDIQLAHEYFFEF